MPKCIIIPHETAKTDEIVAALSTFTRKWHTFKVETAPKYLGFFIGPHAGGYEWHDAFTKHCDRTKRIKAVGHSIVATIVVHNIYALPVFSFLCQLRHPPAWLCDLVDTETMAMF